VTSFNCSDLFNSSTYTPSRNGSRAQSRSRRWRREEEREDESRFSSLRGEWSSRMSLKQSADLFPAIHSTSCKTSKRCTTCLEGLVDFTWSIEMGKRLLSAQLHGIIWSPMRRFELDSTFHRPRLVKARCPLLRLDTVSTSIVSHFPCLVLLPPPILTFD